MPAHNRPEVKVVRPKRTRNAAATKEDILRAALMAFSQRGYDGVSAREIAREVGVNPMLVNRYFGSKEELFAAATDAAFADDSAFAEVFKGDVASLGERLARFIVVKGRTNDVGIDPLLFMLRSAPNSRAAEILRSTIEQRVEAGVRNALSGDGVRERAALLLSLIAGFQLMRSVIDIASLTPSADSLLISKLGKMFQAITEPISPGSSAE
jgi:AcrR family transcriptional regulator